MTGAKLRGALQKMVSSPHTVLPYTHSKDTDTWDALCDLDQDPADKNTVMLIYKQKSDLAENQGKPSGWNREHLWPRSFGVGDSGADTTDLHHLRPADWTVNSARSNLPFGWCNASSACRDMPAHAEADSSTGKDSKTFMPPTSVRGDIARALMYMAVRYDGSDPDSQRLSLSDCPCQHTATMGILSVLLQWHAGDPPSALEIERNDKVRHYTRRWQPHVCRAWPGLSRVSVIFCTCAMCRPFSVYQAMRLTSRRLQL